MCPNRRKRVIGLIGGIGSGKSQVAAELAQRGAMIIQADQLGHQALRQPDIRAQLLKRWGPDLCDDQGEIDRRKVGKLVFAEPAELRILEAAVFPYIEQRMDEQIAEAQVTSAFQWIILDAAILLETGWGQRCDLIVYVHAPRSQRLERVQAQRGWDEKEVRFRSRAQWPLTDKVTRAHVAVDNSGSLADLPGQIDRLLARPELAQGVAV
jgi:dephospho-CoA kinase